MQACGRHRNIIEGVWATAQNSATFPRKNIFFHWIILDTWEILRGRVANRDSINARTPEASKFSGFCCVSLTLREPCARKSTIRCVFCSHLGMFFRWIILDSQFGEWKKHFGKNETRDLFYYVWGDGNRILCLVGATFSWRIIHDLAVARFLSFF